VGAVGRAVVGHHALDANAVAGEEPQRSAQEPDRGGGLLVAQDLGVGQARVVVDGDVHELPAGGAQQASIGLTDAGAWSALATIGGDRVARNDDPTQLLDVDVHQLARPAALIAIGRLERRQARALAQPLAQQHCRDRREWHRQALGDLAGGHVQPSQRADRADAVGRRLARLMTRNGRPIDQPRLAVIAKPGQPPVDRALGDAGGLGRRRHRPNLRTHLLDHPPPTDRTERSSSVHLHPGLLGLSLLGSSQPPARPGCPH
jgi:hypothetical protein